MQKTTIWTMEETDLVKDLFKDKIAAGMKGPEIGVCRIHAISKFTYYYYYYYF